MAPSRTLSVLVLLSLAGCKRESASPARFEVGRVATAAEVAAQDVSVFPDGRGLPPGHGSVREGRALFAAQCAACHGNGGVGSDDYPAPALVGGRGTLTTAAPVLTVGSYWPYPTTLWDYIHRAMPYVAPGSLTHDQVYALTAFILSANGIVPEDTVLDEKSLPRLRMPNRDGFVSDPRPGRL